MSLRVKKNVGWLLLVVAILGVIAIGPAREVTGTHKGPGSSSGEWGLFSGKIQTAGGESVIEWYWTLWWPGVVVGGLVFATGILLIRGARRAQ